MAQYARPTSDISQGSWTDEGTVDNDGNLYTSVDEVAQDGDDSYIETNTDDNVCELGLGSVDDPASSIDHVITIYARSAGGGGAKEKVKVELLEGVTLRATLLSFNLDRSTHTIKTYTLSGAEADSIGDYGNLSFKITCTALGGGETARVTQVFFSVPDAIADKSIMCDPGSYDVVGTDVFLKCDRKISIGTESYSFGGQVVDLLKNSKIEIGADSYVLTGFDVGLIYTPGYTLSAGAGSFVFLGQTVALKHDKLLEAEAGNFIWTGFDVTLTYTTGGYILTAESGSFDWAGQTAGLLKGSRISIDSAAYVISGQPVDFCRGYCIFPEMGTYIIDGQDVTFSKLLPEGAHGFTLHGRNMIIYSTVLNMAEHKTPAVLPNYGRLYIKADKKLYLLDEDGNEHEIAFVT